MCCLCLRNTVYSTKECLPNKIAPCLYPDEPVDAQNGIRKQDRPG